MKLSDFEFSYPPDLVAQEPIEPRDHARLMLTWKSGPERHQYQFCHLRDLLRGDEVIVLNNTRVIPCRLFARRKTGAEIEVFLLRPLKDEWECFISPARRVHPPETLYLESTEIPEVKVEMRDGRWFASFSKPQEEVIQFLRRQGHIPLPPYIRRPDTLKDRDRYQTVFSEIEGSVASPTSNLHFTHDLLRDIKAKGCEILMVTLHIGIATFLPVTEAILTSGRLHEEYYSLLPGTFDRLQQAFTHGQEVVCVGTTALRAVESALEHGHQGWTDMFFYPTRPPRHVRSLITNFHQPSSSLFMLISSLMGIREAKAIYEEAFKEKYRLFSYGDAMWIKILN